MSKAFDRVVAALRDCVNVMDRDLHGLAVIQPELAKAKRALGELDVVEAEMPIDWSQAPVGTTHKRIDDFRFPWRMLSNGLWHSWHDGWMVVTSADPDLYVARPSVEWSGEGMPQADAVCEVMHKGARTHEGWIKAKIMYCGTHVCAFLPMDGKGIEQGAGLESLEFRPIRTPDQIAAEERAKAVVEMEQLIGGARTWPEALRRIHDAGYRKTTE